MWYDSGINHPCIYYMVLTVYWPIECRCSYEKLLQLWAIQFRIPYHSRYQNAVANVRKAIYASLTAAEQIHSWINYSTCVSLWTTRTKCFFLKFFFCNLAFLSLVYVFTYRFLFIYFSGLFTTCTLYRKGRYIGRTYLWVQSVNRCAIEQ